MKNIISIDLFNYISVITTYTFLFFLHNKLFEKKKKGTFKKIIAYLLASVIMIQIHKLGITYVNFFNSILSAQILCSLFYQVSIKKSIFHNIFFQILFTLGDIISAIFMKIITGKLPHDFFEDFKLKIVSFSIYILIILLIYKIYTNIMIKTKRLSLRVKEIAFIIFLTLFEFFILYYMTSLSNDAYGKLMIPIVIGFILMNICIFYIVNAVTVGYESQYELEKIKLKNQIQSDHYDELNRTYIETQCMIHDINKHISAIEELSKNNNFHEATEYTEKLRYEIKKRKKLFECSNKILNAVVNQKISKAESKGITVTIDTKNVTLDFIEDTDVTAIFANIMDNAIEACEEVQENKTISIRISQLSNFIYIDLENSYSGKILKSNDRFITTKKDHMGYGMISIQRTLEKYNGYMNTEQTDKKFIINIVIPIP